MKTDIIIISNNGDHMDDALRLAEKMADYKELSYKNSLHLRLLTEEMLGMMRSITGSAEGRFWIEAEDDEFQLHLKVERDVDFDKRRMLLAAATSGKNEATRGIMGKIRTFFDPIDDMALLPDETVGSMGVNMLWSMSSYQEQIQEKMEQNTDGAAEAWDELEKSVVAHIADDVKVSIRGRNVEMVIYKQMH